MSLRVVLYAEGTGELGGEQRLLPPPGDDLGDDWLGAAHVFVRRALAAGSSIPPAAVRFQSPLRTRKGLTAAGGDFLRAKTLAQLVTWLPRATPPELVVILLDADGETGRKALVESTVKDRVPPAVVAVAVQEFEAWLLADVETLAAVTSTALPSGAPPESRAPREAKRLLNEAMPEPSRRPGQRRSIAEACDLDVISRVCPSFAQLLRDVRNALAALGHAKG